MEATVRIRVLIVDDHPMVRAGLARFLEEDEGVLVVGEAKDGAEAVALCERLAPDVVLMDVVMPVMDGAEATAAITRASPGVRVLALTSYAQDDLVRRTLDAGALGCMLKDARPEALLRAVRDAYAGRGSVDSSVLRAMMQQPREKVGADLTRRELEVLQLLATGLSNDEIAARLVVSGGTVRQHMTHIMSKLQAPNRTAAVVVAIEHGLVRGQGG